MRRSAALLLAVSLLAACGGDDDTASETTTTSTSTSTTSTTEATTSTTGAAAAGTGSAYAEEVCTSIADWYGDIQQASTSLVDEASTVAQDPTAGKDLVLSFLDDAIGFTDDLVADLETAGVPETPGGQATSDALVSGMEDVRELFVGAREDTAALPTDDPQALGSGLQQIGAALQDSATAVSASFQEVLSTIDDPELAQAFEQAPSCQALQTVS